MINYFYRKNKTIIMAENVFTENSAFFTAYGGIHSAGRLNPEGPLKNIDDATYRSFNMWRGKVQPMQSRDTPVPGPRRRVEPCDFRSLNRTVDKVVTDCKILPNQDTWRVSEDPRINAGGMRDMPFLHSTGIREQRIPQSSDMDNLYYPRFSNE